MNPHDLDHTILHHINEKAKGLEDILKSDVVCYFGQIHPQYFRMFRNFIEEVRTRSKRTEDCLTVVLRTPGGSVETTERYVSVIRHHYKYLNFIVPDLAMSAGTIFCMSGDKIYMDYSSMLGPIDPQVMVPDASGYVPALGYLDKVEEITRKGALSPADVVFLRGLDLAKLALFEQARDLSIDLLEKWLVQYKFKDWNTHRTTNKGSPVTASEKTDRAKAIGKALSDHKVWHSHGRALGVSKLRALGLEIEDYSSDVQIRNAVRSYNDLLTAHSDRSEIAFLLHSHLTETL
jgi:Serine dehydrogenase proteinase